MQLIPDTSDPGGYLEATGLVDLDDVSVRRLADSLAAGASGDVEKAGAVFEYMQKNIPHTFNTGRREVARKASDVIRYGHGICYAKANLAAALLRYMGIPTGFCYQKLRTDETPGPGFVIHCVNAVHLNGKWSRMDVRNAVEGIDPAFKPGRDSGVVPADPALGEVDYPAVYARPHPATVEALKASKDADTLRERLPEKL